jgi:hypothetical protein
MLGELAERQDGSFIVRIWWEQGIEDGQAISHWRGWIQHVRNGNHAYFASLRDLTDFLERETGIAQVDDQAAQGLV